MRARSRPPAAPSPAAVSAPPSGLVPGCPRREGGARRRGEVSWGVMAEYRCPSCKKPTEPGARFFPFCSERCKMVDLGAWLDERYRITRPLKAVDVGPEAEGDLPPAPPEREG